MNLASVVLIKALRFGDARGWFCETYSERSAESAGIDVRFVQDNQSFSASVGTVRGLHFQRAPHAQAKLVRCVRGSIMDYAVDIRRGSPTYGKWVGAKLTAEGGEQLYVPVGFAHGFVTLEADVEVAYKVSDFYAPDCDGGIVWNDPTIGIDWPLPSGGAVLSDKDKVLPTLASFESPFNYDGVPLQPLTSA
ncbi:dTDP-4-dehydrorhamnose 3,5-epimerase [Caulobacter segnis]|uniref:dTDP-4-dehydrorhamnose 3,5-epimerase n=1 Tax=Caulobacter segnis TaxID=88688 RepID=UPI001CBE7885|nr:dTDP-4-dehydrorhamnose 3,5-epimerase [Caulobacter segnis]UAL08914.1 dTDP-4-dehydrorhamnose 3,5-epimerase [Caulobacter segnis]